MTVLKDSMKRKRNGKWLGKQSNPVFFYNDTDRLEDFSIPVSDWCRKGSPIVGEEPTKTGFGPVTGSEERRNRYKIADSGDNFRDLDARARSELSQARSAIAMGYTFNGDDGAIRNRRKHDWRCGRWGQRIYQGFK